MGQQENQQEDRREDQQEDQRALQGQNQVQGPTSGQYTNSADVTGDRKIFQEVQQYARSLIGNFLHVSWSVMMLPLLFVQKPG